MKNILFVGDLNKYGRSFRRFKILQNLNFNIFSLSHSLLSHDNKIKKPLFLYRVLNKIMFPNDLTKVNKNILRFLNSENIDIVWIENGITIYPTTLKKIKINYPKIKILSISEDDMCKRHNQSWWYILGLSYYDYVFTTKKHNIECLTNMGAKNVTLFFDSFDNTLHKIYNYKNSIDYKYSVSHIGAYEKERSDYIYFLAINGIKVNVWGNDWDKCKYSHPNFKVNNKFLYGSKYSKTIYKSKINLNF